MRVAGAPGVVAENDGNFGVSEWVRVFVIHMDRFRTAVFEDIRDLGRSQMGVNWTDYRCRSRVEGIRNH